MKGIILAGGKGLRLYPLTKYISKQLLPVYDKPMIYYPLAVLLLAGIKDILIISTPEDIGCYEKLFSDGRDLGVCISYQVQEHPNGIAEAFILAKDFIGTDRVCLILGDNVFYGHDLVEILKNSMRETNGAVIFAYPAKDPSGFGVVEFDSEFRVLSLEEKPKVPKSDYVVPGLYFYDNDVIGIAERLIPSSRGELEITDVNREYLKRGKLKVNVFGREIVWFDTGTPYGILRAGEFVEKIQKQQGIFVAAIEETAWRQGLISTEQLRKLGVSMKSTEYGQHLISLTKDEKKK